MIRFASVVYPMSWEKDLESIFCDFVYSCNEVGASVTRAKTYVAGLKTYATTHITDYNLKEDERPTINIGMEVSRNPKKDIISISFTLAKKQDYFDGGQTITATRYDFYDLVDLYGIAGAFENVIREALDEYDTTAKLKDYVVTNVNIIDNTL